MKLLKKVEKTFPESSEKEILYLALLNLAELLNQQTDFDEILRLIGLHSRQLLHADYSSVVMINPKTRETMKTVIKGGLSSDEQNFHYLQKNIIGWMLKNDQMFFTTNIRTDERFRKSSFKDSPYGAIMCVCITFGGMKLGHLLLINKKGGFVFLQQDMLFLQRFAHIIAPYLNNTLKIAHYFKTKIPDQVLISKFSKFNLIGKSPAFVQMLHSIESAASCDVRVILEGASGSGKELVARAIHGLSNRHNQPFIAVDCGSIQPTLIESELFGHVKGAFTGAAGDRTGLIAAADKGTLFMDEIHNLPYDLQAKLLRFLQENEIRKVGSNISQTVDVRIIAATSSHLTDLIQKNKFREDLFYRLHVFPIQVPSLSEKTEDIPLLANAFLKNFSALQNKNLELFDPLLMKYIQYSKWDGNVRELENFVERLVTLAPGDDQILDSSLLPPEEQKRINKMSNSIEDFPLNQSLQDFLQECEAEFLIKALNKNNWNQSRTARILCISEGTLRYKMEKLKISKPNKIS